MMKNIVLLCSILLCALCAHAQTIIVGSLTTVNNTTAVSTTNVIGTVAIPRNVFTFQDNGGMATTNQLVFNVQVSVDTNSWITVASSSPTGTNAASWTFIPNYSAQPVLMRLQVVTTTNVAVAASYQ